MNNVFVSDSQIGWFDIIERRPAIEVGARGIDYVCGKTVASCDSEEDADFIADAINEKIEREADDE